MLMLQLLWFTAWISVTVGTGARSRAAFGDSAAGGSAFLLLWGTALLLTWTTLRRLRTEGRAAANKRMLLVPVLLAGLAIPVAIKGDGGVRYLGTLLATPFVALLLCPAAAFVARRSGSLLRRSTGLGSPTAAYLPADALPLVRCLVPALVFPALAAGVLRAPLHPALEGLLAPNGLCGLLFGELAVWGVAAAVILGSGLDALDGSDDGPLTRALLTLGALALLSAALLLPAPSAFAMHTRMRWPDGTFETVELPLDAMRRAAPTLLLALAWLLRRDLRALAAGAAPPTWTRQLALVLVAFVAARFGAPSWGVWSAPALTALACAVAFAVDRPRFPAVADVAVRA